MIKTSDYQASGKSMFFDSINMLQVFHQPMDPSRSHYATRKSVREGRASPPTSLRSTSRATSPASPSSDARKLPKTRPVSTELLYSEVATGLPRAPPSRGSQTSEVLALTSDVDFDV